MLSDTLVYKSLCVDKNYSDTTSFFIGIPKGTINISLDDIKTKQENAASFMKYSIKYNLTQNDKDIYMVSIKTTLFEETEQLDVLKVVFKIDDNKTFEYEPKLWQYIVVDNLDSASLLSFGSLPDLQKYTRNINNLYLYFNKDKEASIKNIKISFNDIKIETINGKKENEFYKQQEEEIKYLDLCIKIPDKYIIKNIAIHYNILIEVESNNTTYNVISSNLMLYNE